MTIRRSAPDGKETVPVWKLFQQPVNLGYLKNANGNQTQAILDRNKAAYDWQRARRAAEAANPKFGIPAVHIDGKTYIHKLANLLAEYPDLPARQIAELIGSSEAAVGTYRQRLKDANGDPDEASRVHSSLSADHGKAARVDANKWRDHQEWLASGIPDK